MTHEFSAMAKPHCEHYFAYHCFGGMSVRLCMVCHEPDWDDHRKQLEAAAQAAIAARRDSDRACAFEIARGTSISLRCPDCGGLLLLDSARADVLGDVISAASAHMCREWDSADSNAAVAAAPACPCGGTGGFAVVAQLEEENAQLRTVVAGVRALCMDTDGDWLPGESQLPVGEFQAALAARPAGGTP